MSTESCLFFSVCKNLKTMRERHGTPAQFEVYVWGAFDHCDITWSEADEAIKHYRRCWRRGTCVEGEV